MWPYVYSQSDSRFQQHIECLIKTTFKEQLGNSSIYSYDLRDFYEDEITQKTISTCISTTCVMILLSMCKGWVREEKISFAPKNVEQVIEDDF